MFDKLAAMGKVLALKDRTLNSLSVTEVQGLANSFGLQIDLTDDLKRAGVALLQEQDIDTVADMIQKPESIQQLLGFLDGGSSQADEPSEVERQVGAMALNLF